MKTRVIGLLVTLSLGMLTVPAMAQQPDDEGGRRRRPDKLAEEIDEARVRVELLEMELQADREHLRRSFTSLRSAESRVRGSGQPEMPEEFREQQAKFAAEMRKQIEEEKARFVERSRELAREKRRLEELERRLRPSRREPRGDQPRNRPIAALADVVRDELERGVAGPPELERRIDEMDKKLERVIRELEELKGKKE